MDPTNEVSAFAVYNTQKKKEKKKGKKNKPEDKLKKGKKKEFNDLLQTVIMRELARKEDEDDSPKQTKVKKAKKKKVKISETETTLTTEDETTPLMDNEPILLKKNDISTISKKRNFDEIDEVESEGSEVPFEGSKPKSPSKRMTESNSPENDVNKAKKKTKLSLNNVKFEDQTLLNGTLNFNSPTEQSTPNIDKKKDSSSEGIEKIKKKKAEVPRNDSVTDGMNIFKLLLDPIEIHQFYNDFWEKEPCLIKRQNTEYFSNIISFDIIDKMLRENYIEFTKNVDITSYENGERKTLNPPGRALPGTVWSYYADGCSIRLLNPQTFIPTVFQMNSSLQEYFHCMVGANVYLTPPNSQGFAPHYDDIEAFVLQIEGKKRWRLYNPRNKQEVLPRTSSGNFAQNEIGEPILDCVLEPGHLLYFPRGVIHQASTETGCHSLHITLSVYQKNSYADLFEQLVPIMLSRAINEDVEFRKGLPLNIWHNFGVVHSDTRSKDREDIIKKCQDLLQKIATQLPIDGAVDQLAKKFQHDALPPDITPSEKLRTIFGTKTTVSDEGEAVWDYDFNLQTNIRLLRANILRLVEENDEIRVYYYTDNSREYHEYEPNYLETHYEEATSVEYLIKSYPEYIKVKDLPLDDDGLKISFAQGLFERGLLMTNKPLT